MSFGILGRLLLDISSFEILPGGQGVVRCPGPLENGKGSGFDWGRGAPIEHILLDIDDEADEDKDEDDKDDEDVEDDEDGKDNKDDGCLI